VAMVDSAGENHQDNDGSLARTRRSRISLPSVSDIEAMIERLNSYMDRKSFDFFSESPTATSRLGRKDRVIAAAVAALCFHSSIILFKISYNLAATPANITRFGVMTSLFVTVYWSCISGIVFSGYTRNADFPHIFRASILFQTFVLKIGFLGSFIALHIFA
jgi:hypothetical protein